MPPALSDDEDYASSADSDFAPDDAPQRDSSPSDSESEAEPQPESKRAPEKRKHQQTDEAEDAGIENSGDEAIISRGRKKQKKDKGRDGKADEETADHGEGGLIKTRSMRAAGKEERKVAAVSGPVTVDVDALWAQMMIGSSPTALHISRSPEAAKKTVDASPKGPSKQAADESAMIRIKRTYNFAGKVHTEEKLVARDSAEAKLFLTSQAGGADGEEDPEKRMPRRAFRSAFEPVLEPLAQRADLNLNMEVRLRAREEKAAKKLNTVEKSRMDWAGFVDREGIQDELALAGRSKTSYTAREDFLARTEAGREEEARRARIAGRT